MSKMQSHKENGFKVPDRYFEEKLEGLKRDFQGQEADPLFNLPEGYFDDAKAKIKAKIRTETTVRPIWIRYAAAAAIFLIGGLIWWNASSKKVDDQQDWLAQIGTEDLSLEWFELDEMEATELAELDLLDLVEIDREELEAYFLEEDWDDDELAQLYSTH